MKAKEYRKMTEKELEKELKKLKMELIKTYSMIGNAKIKDKKKGTTTGGINLSKRIRKEIARVKTILREKR